MRADRQAGFALAEVLATLAIGGAVLLALASLTHLVSQHTWRTAERVESAERANRALSAIARDIALAGRARWFGPATARPFVFRGGPDRVLFAMASEGGGADAVVQIQMSPQENALLRARAVFRPAAAGLSGLAFAPPERLYEGAMRLRFAYVKAASAGSPERLLDDWVAPDAMPVAVRIGVVRPGADAPAFSVRVPLRVEAEVGCASPSRAGCSRMNAADIAAEDAATAAGPAKPGPREL